MAGFKLIFKLYTIDTAESVSLLGSWDGYSRKLPLDQKCPGEWEGAFEFSDSTLRPGGRYWYYYLTDGYHDYNECDTWRMEPTTGRRLNIINVPSSLTSNTSAAADNNSPSVQLGRPVSTSQIISPKPIASYTIKSILECESVDPDTAISQPTFQTLVSNITRRQGALFDGE